RSRPSRARSRSSGPHRDWRAGARGWRARPRKRWRRAPRWRLAEGKRASRSALEQHDDRAAAAVDRARLHEGEHIVAAREQLADAALQHRLAPGRAQALAVHDAHAAQPAPAAAGEEHRGLGGRLDARQAMQVQVRLHDPVRAAKLPQDVARQPGPQVRRVVLDLVVIVESEAGKLVEHGLLVFVALGREGRGLGPWVFDSIGGRDGRDIPHGFAKLGVSRLAPRLSRLAPRASCLAPRARLLHPRLSRYLSASSAAMHPVPALVTACRYTWSWTSPAAKTPGTLVAVALPARPLLVTM